MPSALPEGEPAPSDGYRLIGRFPDMSSVWAVTAPAAPAYVMLSGGFALPRGLDDGTVGYPLIASGGVAVMELHARAPGVVRVVFDARAPGARQFRVQDTQGEHAYTVNGTQHFDLAVEVPRGSSQLLLKVDPAATSESDALVLSQPVAVATSGPAALHAIPVSADPGF